MKPIMKTRMRRALIPLAALAVAAAIVPAAGAADCTMAPGATCKNQDMRHLGMKMMYADMTGADMRGADMRGMNLTGINLTNADMRGAKLDGAKMNGAVLKGATFRGTKMKNVKMTGVQLINADMQNMTLTNVKIHDAIVSNVNIAGSKFIGGGMTNSTITGMKSRPTRTTRNDCTHGVGTSTVFQARYLGALWQSNYSFAGSTLAGNYQCDKFVGINWDGTTIQDADFTGTLFQDAQDHSEQILAVNVNFSYAQFNDAFWRPALAFGVNLNGASCPDINNDQSNAVWGRYDRTSPYWVGSTQSGHWAYGIVESTFFGDIKFTQPPSVVNVSKARQTIISQARASIAQPWVIHGSSNCTVEPSVIG